MENGRQCFFSKSMREIFFRTFEIIIWCKLLSKNILGYVKLYIWIFYSAFKIIGKFGKTRKALAIFQIFLIFFFKKIWKKNIKIFIVFFVAFSNVFKNLGKKLNFKILTLLPRTKQVAYMGHIYKYMNILSMSFPPVDKPQCKKKAKNDVYYSLPPFLFLFFFSFFIEKDDQKKLLDRLAQNLWVKNPKSGKGEKG